MNSALATGLGIVLLLMAVLPGRANAAGDGYFQGLIGAGDFDADSLTFRVPSNGASEEKDLSSMPHVGLYGQHILAGTTTRVGVEGGALFGWRSRKTTILLSNTRAVVDIDSSFWMFDLSAGLCLSQDLGRRWRFYLGGGPAMLFAEYETDGNLEDGDSTDPDAVAAVADESHSEFGIGLYARAGLEYEFFPTALIGISVRGLASNLEFDNAIGSSGVSGLQGFITFTRHFRAP